MHKRHEAGTSFEVPACGTGRLAAATAVAATTVAVVGGSDATTAAVVINQQQNDDDQQDPVAVTPTEQVTQTHLFHPLTITVYAGKQKGCVKIL